MYSSLFPVDKVSLVPLSCLVAGNYNYCDDDNYNVM